MTGRAKVFSAFILILMAAFFANLSLGATNIAPEDIILAFFSFDADNYDHFVVIYQRLPRVLIAVFVGSVMACSGAVLQGLMRNPLASPALLGINAGATLFVVGGVIFFGISSAFQGIAALIGGICGFGACLTVARMSGMDGNPRGLSLILSGAVVSMLFIGIANALLLSTPELRNEFLGWVTGNINHVYIDRLHQMWPVGVGGVVVLLILSRALTLIALGPEKAASAGVNIVLVSRLTIASVVLSSSAAVAICGPIGFVGLVVPHIVRPLVGAKQTMIIPGCILVGASICLIADMVARLAFSPFVLHTGVMMDLFGGVVFAFVVRRYYLTPGLRRSL